MVTNYLGTGLIIIKKKFTLLSEERTIFITRKLCL